MVGVAPRVVDTPTEDHQTNTSWTPNPLSAPISGHFSPWAERWWPLRKGLESGIFQTKSPARSSLVFDTGRGGNMRGKKLKGKKTREKYAQILKLEGGNCTFCLPSCTVEDSMADRHIRPQIFRSCLRTETLVQKAVFQNYCVKGGKRISEHFFWTS